MTGCDGGTGHWDGSGDTTTPTVLTTDTIAPIVTLTIPADSATGVLINSSLSVTFTEAMDPLTINDASFTLTDGVTAVPGTVTYSGVTAVFNPTDNLADDTTYTATITTGAEDLAGNALANDYVWTFTTGATTDDTPPIVTLTIPADGATGVLISRNLSATFTEAMDPLTINDGSFTLTDGVTAVPGTVTYSGVTAVFNPTDNLAVDTTYTATITTGAKDLAGNALANDKVWSFTTAAAIDDTAPTVTSTDPVDGATDVPLSKKIYATFSEAMDPLTINTATFTLEEGATAVTGTVSYVGLVASFTPTIDLQSNTIYTATITTVSEDLAGNQLASDEVWSFTTIAEEPLGPPPVDLGTAADFVILSKSGISNVPDSAITGNIGVSPIDSTAITGWPLTMDVSLSFSTTPTIIGKVYAADYADPTPTKLTTAISDMETAYVDAAGRAIPDATELGAGNLTGQNLAPGLYKWSTGISVDPAGTVTLTGGATDVWILQIAGDITMNPGASVTLAGGALAKNVFWQVGGGTGVTLDTTVAFQGNILAINAIIMKAGASVNGRLLAQKAVTLISNTVTTP
jgi:hypothetical protein